MERFFGMKLKANEDYAVYRLMKAMLPTQGEKADSAFVFNCYLLQNLYI
jgi:hypothetical protein